MHFRGNFWGLNWEEKGIKIQGEMLNNLRFADDVILISCSREELQQMANEFEKESKKAGLTMNISKTALLSTSKEEMVIKINGEEIRQVEETQYLGQTVALNNRLDKEISKRIEKAWKNFWGLKSIYKSKMGLKSKIKILDSCTIPVITYGSQTWATTKTQIGKIQKTQLAMLRSILGKKRRDRISNRKIREKTKSRDIGYIIKKLKWKYAGHIIRRKGNRWEKTVLNWVPYDQKRKKGRPKTRWVDEINKYAGVLWQRDAWFRECWKKVGEAYAQRWAII